MPRRALVPVLLAALVPLALASACGNGSEPRDAAPLADDAFTGQAEEVRGGTVDLSSFADQDLVVWFWAPW